MWRHSTQHLVLRLIVWALILERLGSNPDAAAYQLCDLEALITQSIWFPFLQHEENNDSPYFTGK